MEARPGPWGRHCPDRYFTNMVVLNVSSVPPLGNLGQRDVDFWLHNPNCVMFQMVSGGSRSCFSAMPTNEPSLEHYVTGLPIRPPIDPIRQVSITKNEHLWYT
jgi:hypothetical protein